VPPCKICHVIEHFDLKAPPKPVIYSPFGCNFTCRWSNSQTQPLTLPSHKPLLSHSMNELTLRYRLHLLSLLCRPSGRAFLDPHVDDFVPPHAALPTCRFCRRDRAFRAWWLRVLTLLSAWGLGEIAPHKPHRPGGFPFVLRDSSPGGAASIARPCRPLVGPISSALTFDTWSNMLPLKTQPPFVTPRTVDVGAVAFSLFKPPHFLPWSFGFQKCCTLLPLLKTSLAVEKSRPEVH